MQQSTKTLIAALVAMSVFFSSCRKCEVLDPVGKWGTSSWSERTPNDVTTGVTEVFDNGTMVSQSGSWRWYLDIANQEFVYIKVSSEHPSWVYETRAIKIVKYTYDRIKFEKMKDENGVLVKYFTTWDRQ